MRRIARQKGILEQQRWVVLGASFEPSASPLVHTKPECPVIEPPVDPDLFRHGAHSTHHKQGRQTSYWLPPLSYMPNDQTCMSIHTHFVPGAQTRTIPASALVDNVSEPAADSTYSGRDVSMGASSSATMQENGRGRCTSAGCRS